MPIGTSDGEQYDDELQHVLAQAAPKRVYITKDDTPASPQGDAFKPPVEAPAQPAGAFNQDLGTPVAPDAQASPEPSKQAIPDFTDVYGTPPDKQLWPERLVAGVAEQAKNALSLMDAPEWAVDPDTGEVHTSTQAVEKASDLAGLMTFGPAPVANKMADGTLGSFMGVKSKTINKDKLYQAQNMKSDGVHPDDIWAKTGTFQGADQRWRQEIPDNTAVLRNENLDHLPATSGKGWESVGRDESIGLKPTYKGFKETNPKTPQEYEDFFRNVIQGTKAKPMNVEDVFHHPDLFAAYPHLGKIPVKPIEEYRGGMSTKNVLGIHAQGDAIYMARQDPEQFKSVLLHELQHAIQEHEGFGKGGNTGMFLPPELGQAEKEFEKIREEMEPKVAEDLKTDLKGVNSIKNVIRAEQEDGALNLPPETNAVLNRLKEEHPTVYKRLSNIVKSEQLIQEAKDNAFESYKRLAGEVESRNVETRMKMNRIELQRQSPINTQDRPTYSQIVQTR